MTLQEENEKLRGLLREFCERVERGEVRSKSTYAKFRDALSQQAEPRSVGMCGNLENPGQRCICREEFGYRVCKADPAPAQDEQQPVKLQHMACVENGIFRWATGRKIDNCELYTMPDFGRAPKLYTDPQPEQSTLTEIADLLDCARFDESADYEKAGEVIHRLRAIHAMILNALDRDAAEGKAVRGEMATELRAALSTKEK